MRLCMCLYTCMYLCLGSRMCAFVCVCSCVCIIIINDDNNENGYHDTVDYGDDDLEMNEI